ncbi:hypothetical protein ACX9NE_08560 [Mycobacterium sp. ML4]
MSGTAVESGGLWVGTADDGALQVVRYDSTHYRAQLAPRRRGGRRPRPRGCGRPNHRDRDLTPYRDGPRPCPSRPCPPPLITGTEVSALTVITKGDSPGCSTWLSAIFDCPKLALFGISVDRARR